MSMPIVNLVFFDLFLTLSCTTKGLKSTNDPGLKSNIFSVNILSFVLLISGYVD